ncbi:acyltransferase domain-containing protein [Fodinicola feengrottensis]|uniref:Acyltransferase n=1 Tax=Fodinicola feengrottensis TaxID=435914 RepID=A0ABN2H9Z8_9ACTN|nr:acyltransferase domain-containing protein [Fodinicola feengrottensis]
MPDPRASLGFAPPANEWLDSIQNLAATEVVLPDDHTADQQLRDLGVLEADRADILAARPAQPELRWLLDRCHTQLVADIDQSPGMLPWPELPTSYGPVGRFFYVWVFLTALPAIRDWHAQHGITDAESREILQDVGRQIAVHRRLFDGVSGLHTQAWLTLHFRAQIFSFGRLQFERQHSRVTVPDVLALGDPVLSVHIPETGPLLPAACDASFAAAAKFYREHFPAEKYELAVCRSWLMDTQLADYLPAESNIMAFQNRFTSSGEQSPGDAAVLEFVFRYAGTNLDSLPQDTGLQRAVVAHLRSGKRWLAATSYCRL